MMTLTVASLEVSNGLAPSSRHRKSVPAAKVDMSERVDGATARRSAGSLTSKSYRTYASLRRAVFDKREDVWRFMRSIGQAAEGRVWHEEDKLKVKLLLSTIRKTTGKRPRQSSTLVPSVVVYLKKRERIGLYRQNQGTLWRQ